MASVNVHTLEASVKSVLVWIVCGYLSICDIYQIMVCIGICVHIVSIIPGHIIFHNMKCIRIKKKKQPINVSFSTKLSTVTVGNLLLYTRGTEYSVVALLVEIVHVVSQHDG